MHKSHVGFVPLFLFFQELSESENNEYEVTFENTGHFFYLSVELEIKSIFEKVDVRRRYLIRFLKDEDVEIKNPDQYKYVKPVN